jgi:DNA topoisomerase-1
MVAFGDALPQIRARIEHDLGLPGLPREKVLAAVVRLLQTTLIRVGNDEYARQNQHYGLTTMHNEHVEVKGSKVHFDFVGKSGKERVLDLKDPRIARIVKKCQDLPGQDLFEYVDDEGNVRDVSSQDVNDYLREITGEAFTAKDFRTWAGTLLCTLNLRAFEPFETQTQAKKNVVQAIKIVAEQLGNTPAVCRKSYVHPAVLNRYVEGV